MNWAMPCAPAGLTAAGVEEAFLPDQAGEEAGVEPVAARGGLDDAADVGDVGREADAGGAVGGAALVARSGSARGGLERRHLHLGRGLGANDRREAGQPREDRKREDEPPSPDHGARLAASRQGLQNLR